MNLFTDPNYEESVRKHAEAGWKTSKILRSLAAQIGPEQITRITLIAYLVACFEIELSESMVVGSWEFFDDGVRSDDEIDHHFAPMIKLWLDKQRRTRMRNCPKEDKGTDR